MSGWDASAAAWIAIQGETGDFGRVHVLDVPMLALVDERAPARMLVLAAGKGASAACWPRVVLPQPVSIRPLR